MKNKLITLLALFSLLSCSFATAHVTEAASETEEVTNANRLRVLQFNTWSQGTVVDGGSQGVRQTIDEMNPDIVLLQEIRGQKFIDETIAYLKEKGKTYYGHSLNVSTAFMSKYPIDSIRGSKELGKDSYAFVKASVHIHGIQFVFYSAHFDWKHLAHLNIKGVDGHASANPRIKIKPWTDMKQILAENALSRRPVEIETIIQDAQKELDQNHVVIIGGDLNEPSHLDWKKNTRHLRDHHGMVVNWPVSAAMKKAGYKDCYRTIYPNAVTHPGFTHPAGNRYADAKKLTSSYGIDNRERIDHNYFHPDKRIRLVHAQIIGPQECYYNGTMHPNDGKDSIYTPHGVWGSDHKAVLTEYLIKP